MQFVSEIEIYPDSEGLAHLTLATFVSNPDRNRDSTACHPVEGAISLACRRRLRFQGSPGGRFVPPLGR